MKEYNEILDILKKEKFWGEGCPVRLQLFHYIMQCFVNNESILGKPALTYSFDGYKEGVVAEITPWQEKYDLFEELFEKSKKNNDYLRKFVKPFWRLKEEVRGVHEETMNVELSELSDDDLANLYKKLHKVLYEFVIYGTYFEIVDPYSETMAEKLKKKYDLEGKDVAGMVVTLSTPEKRSFLTQEKMDFAKLCLGKISVRDFHKKYFWMDSTYKDAPELTQNEIKKRVEKELNEKSKLELENEIRGTIRYEYDLVKKKEEIINEIGLDEDDKLLFSLIAELGRLIDKRKVGMMTGNYSKYHIIAEIARRKEIALDDLMFFTEEETIKFLLSGEVDINEILKRKGLCFIYNAPGEEQIFVGDEAKELYEVYMKNILGEDFKGNVTYDPGEKVIGKVCRVINTKIDKFEEGSILVTTMTRPDFMPLMRKAKAVITDEGGLTCHAAIVSREMKIPCIVGTKIGTKMLKTGDVVEMNFCLGKVHKVKGKDEE